MQPMLQLHKEVPKDAPCRSVDVALLLPAVGDALWCRVAGGGSAEGSTGQGWFLTPLRAFGPAEVS